VARGPPPRAAGLDLGAALAVDRLEAAGPADGFIVAAPTILHAQCVRALLATGKPIFCEKPLAPDVDEARDLARQGQGRLFVMEKWRYHGGVETLGELARSGRYGALLSLTTRRRQWGTPHVDVDPVWILAPHDVSIVREVLGQLPPVRHARAVGTAAWMEEIDVVLGDGPSALISVSGISGETERLVSAVFEHAVVTLRDPLGDHLEVIARGGPAAAVERLPIPVDMPLLKELAAFVGFLRGGPPPKTDGDDAVLTVERLAQMRAAALA
jgi:predicted dehydrogenase